MINNWNILEQEIKETKKARQKVDNSIQEAESSFEALFDDSNLSASKSESSNSAERYKFIILITAIVAAIVCLYLAYEKQRREREERNRERREKLKRLQELLDATGLSEYPDYEALLRKACEHGHSLDRTLNRLEFIVDSLVNLTNLYAKRNSFDDKILGLTKRQVSIRLKALLRLRAHSIRNNLKRFLRMFRRVSDSEEAINMRYQFVMN
ncbi:MAG: hypothetical protein Crog4KO_24010 [Crocinitomicaceae bacterium]